MIKIHKEVYGQGKPIVLIHGWAMHSGVWRQFARQLAKNYQVICLDLPGHGLSESVAPYTLDNISTALIESLPQESCCLLGWSLGAMVVLAIAEKVPAQIHSLIILAGTPQFVQSEGWDGVDLLLLDKFSSYLSENPQMMLSRFIALQVMGLSQRKEILAGLKKEIQDMPVASKKTLQSGLDILKNEDLRECLARINCPISVIQGDRDTLIPKTVGRAIQKIQPASDINMIGGAGHVPFLSHPNDVINRVNKFYVY